MRVEFGELDIDLGFLPGSAVVEGDLLGVVDQLVVLRAVFTLQLLLNRSQLTKGWRDEANNDTRYKVPSKDHSGPLIANQLSQLPREQYDV